MEIKRNGSLEKLSKQPLALVLIQIRFSPVLNLEAYIESIQSNLRELGYPLVDTNENLSVNVTPTGVNSSKSLQWTFKTADEQSNIILDRNQISFQTTNYDIFTSFYNSFEAICSGVFRAIKDFSSSNIIQRLGLRYIDQIIPQSKEDTVSSYIKTDFNTSPLFEKQPKVSTITQAGIVNLEDDMQGMVTVKIFEGERGMSLPPELLPRAPKLQKVIPHGIPAGLIDIDHGYVPAQPFKYEAERIKNIFLAMHTNTDETFLKIVSEEGLKKWK